jgi:hypothetical protein
MRPKPGKCQGAHPDDGHPDRRKTTRVTNSRRHIRLTVDIDLTTTAIQGVLSHDAGPDQPFAGWTAFVRAVEVALDLGRRTDAPTGAN